MARDVLGVLTPVAGGDLIELTLDEVVVGRRDSCDLVLSHPNVSSVHCRLAFRMGKWIVEDLRSSNGVKVNGDRIPPNAPRPLSPGDEVTFRQARLRAGVYPGRRSRVRRRNARRVRPVADGEGGVAEAQG